VILVIFFKTKHMLEYNIQVKLWIITVQLIHSEVLIAENYGRKSKQMKVIIMKMAENVPSLI